jgi:hypothetical protein
MSVPMLSRHPLPLAWLPAQYRAVVTITQYLRPDGKLFGPEFYDTCGVDAQPVTPIETAGEMFGQWAEEDR